MCRPPVFQDKKPAHRALTGPAGYLSPSGLEPPRASGWVGRDTHTPAAQKQTIEDNRSTMTPATILAWLGRAMIITSLKTLLGFIAAAELIDLRPSFTNVI